MTEESEAVSSLKVIADQTRDAARQMFDSIGAEPTRICCGGMAAGLVVYLFETYGADCARMLLLNCQAMIDRLEAEQGRTTH